MAAWTLVAAPLTHAASSASFMISNAVLDAAGGTSSSASHIVSACVGSEIAGTQSSASFRVDSGCGPSALAIAADFPQLGGGPREIPTLSGAATGLLVTLLAVAAIRRLRAARL